MQLQQSFFGTFPLVVVSIGRLEQNTGWQSNHRQITNLNQTIGKPKTQNKHYIKENLWNNEEIQVNTSEASKQTREIKDYF